MSNPWLIRRANNWIHGPVSQEVLCQMILAGELDLQDEICPSAGYWISLHERQEIYRALGVHVPKTTLFSEGEDEEITETQTEVEFETQEAKSLSPEYLNGNLETTVMLKLKSVKNPRSHVPGFSAKPAPAPAHTSSPNRTFSIILISSGAILVILFLKWIKS